MTSLIIDGLVFKALSGAVEFEIIGDKLDLDYINSARGKDVPFSTKAGTIGVLHITECDVLPCDEFPCDQRGRKSIIKIKAALRLGE